MEQLFIAGKKLIDCFGPVLYMELFVDVVGMLAHGARGYAEFVGNFFI